MKAVLMSLMLMACTTAEESISKHGGKAPIACISEIKGYSSIFKTCRDAGGMVWICSIYGGDHTCVPTHAIMRQWLEATPESPTK